MLHQDSFAKSHFLLVSKLRMKQTRTNSEFVLKPGEELKWMEASHSPGVRAGACRLLLCFGRNKLFVRTLSLAPRQLFATFINITYGAPLKQFSSNYFSY